MCATTQALGKPKSYQYKCMGEGNAHSCYWIHTTQGAHTSTLGVGEGHSPKVKVWGGATHLRWKVKKVWAFGPHLRWKVKEGVGLRPTPKVKVWASGPHRQLGVRCAPSPCALWTLGCRGRRFGAGYALTITTMGTFSTSHPLRTHPCMRSEPAHVGDC